jgi:hypothetical protein
MYWMVCKLQVCKLVLIEFVLSKYQQVNKRPSQLMLINGLNVDGTLSRLASQQEIQFNSTKVLAKSWYLVIGGSCLFTFICPINYT